MEVHVQGGDAFFFAIRSADYGIFNECHWIELELATLEIWWVFRSKKEVWQPMKSHSIVSLGRKIFQYLNNFLHKSVLADQSSEYSVQFVARANILSQQTCKFFEVVSDFYSHMQILLH